MSNVEKFTGRVEDYERYRLRYPPELLKSVKSGCGLSWGHFVADIGAGTGMLAELFLEHGNSVVAIEPNAEMRAACEKLATVWPGLTVQNGTAEATGLPDASVDVVAVGRAMHWFDFDAAMKEFRRILKPDGWIVLAAHGRANSTTRKQREFDQILMQHGTGYKQIKQRLRVHEQVIPLLRPETLCQNKIHGEQKLTLEQFLGQVQSLSAAPLPGQENFELMQKALRDFFERWHEGGILHMKTTSYLTCGQLKPAA
jgi:SAM-dependent methyltransferase